MADRPDSFDVTTPMGSSSPREGDEQLRMIKTFTRNGWQDMTANVEGVDYNRHNLFGANFTVTDPTGVFTGNVVGDLEGRVGQTNPQAISGTEIRAVDSSDGNTTGRFIGPLEGDVTAANIAVTDNITAASITGVVGSVTQNAGSFTTVNAIEGFVGPLQGNVDGSLVGNVTGDVTGNLTGNVTGDLDGVVGGTTPAAGTFTTCNATSFSGPITGDVTGNVVGNVTGNVTGNLTGNADTADTWQTPRTIQLTGDVLGTITGVDGSRDVVINTSLQATATQGTAVASAARWTTGRSISVTGDVTGSVTGVDGSSDVTIPISFASGAFDDVTVRDANSLTTPRSIALSGAVFGSVNFDGSSDVSIHTTYPSNIESINRIAPTANTFIAGNGSGWVQQNALQARTTLGLGTAATAASTDFATQMQGQLADSAQQPNTAVNTGTGTLTVNGVVFSVSGGRIRASSGGTTLFSVDTTTGDLRVRGNIIADTTP